MNPDIFYPYLIKSVVGNRVYYRDGLKKIDKQEALSCLRKSVEKFIEVGVYFG